MRPPPPPPKLLSDGGAPSETEEGTAKRKRGKDTYYDKSEDFEKLAAKDELTLMLRQLHPKTGEFDVFKLFSKAGKVTDVRLITDERTGKCLGAGYIEMADGGSFSRALQLDGSLIRDMPIIVQPSYAEKNRLAAKGATPAAIKAAGMMAGATLGMGSGVESGMKLYVGNLHSEITEEQLRGVFSPFGFLERIDIHREQATGEARYGFLHFALAADGKRCMDQMDGFNLAGRNLRVSLSGQDSSMSSSGAGEGGGNGTGGGNGRAGDYMAIERLDTLNDEGPGGGGTKVTAAQRAQIMARLAEKKGVTLTNEVLQTADGIANFGDSKDKERCVVLKNMFDRLSDDVTADPDAFYKELANDVRTEASKRTFADTSHTLRTHLADSSQTPPRHPPGTSQTPPRHLPDTAFFFGYALRGLLFCRRPSLVRWCTWPPTAGPTASSTSRCSRIRRRRGSSRRCTGATLRRTGSCVSMWRRRPTTRRTRSR